MHKFLFTVVIGGCCLSASTLSPISYSMPNGSIGASNQTSWEDTIYLPCPGSNCTTASAALSGGTGKLTDGVISTLSWDQQPVGPSTFVGWNQVNPTLTFFFAGSVNIDTVMLHVDDALGRGLVNLPASVTIANQTFIIPADNVNGSPRWLSFNNLGLTGSSVSITLTRSNNWMMLDEVTFDGSTAPEPGPFALIAAGIAGLLARKLIAARRGSPAQPEPRPLYP